jgi:hypothetical protein
MSYSELNQMYLKLQEHYYHHKSVIDSDLRDLDILHIVQE